MIKGRFAHCIHQNLTQNHHQNPPLKRTKARHGFEKTFENIMKRALLLVLVLAFDLRLAHGIRSGNPESLLPAKAIVHFKVRNPQELLQNLEIITQNILPVKALPPQARLLFQKDHPLLTLWGMPILKAPLTSERIAEALGLNSESTLTLTFYPGDPSRFFVLSAGLADAKAFLKMLSNRFGGRLEETSIGGHTMHRLQIGQSLIFLTSSEDRVYLSGEPSLLLHLHQPGSVPSIEEDLHMSKVLKLIAQKDIAISINPELIKPFTSQLPFFKYLPLTFLAHAREMLMKEMPQSQKEAIERELQMRFGIENMDALLDYAECFLAASYEELFDAFYNRVDGLKGWTFAAQMHPDFPQVSFYLHHDHFRLDNQSASISLPAINDALGQICPQTQCIWVSGQRHPKLPSAWMGRWLVRVRDLIIKKKLDTKIIDTMQTLYEKTRLINPIEAKSDWTMRAQVEVHSRESLASFASIEDWIADRQASAFHKKSRKVSILPGKDIAFLESHFEESIEAKAANRALVNTLFNSRPSFILTEQRLLKKSLEDEVTQLIFENAYRTRGGFFGYDQHEFINRKIYHARRFEDYLVYHQSVDSPSWLQSLSSSHDSLALQHLIDRLPEGINGFFAYRGIGRILEMVDGMEQFEALIHRDIEGYLSKVREIAEQSDDEETMFARLRSLPYSPAVATLNRDASGEFYCLLPGNMIFPRERLMPFLGELFEPSKSQNKGGLIAYSKARNGTQEWSILWNIEALSALIQSFGNALAESYLHNPEGIQRFMNLAIHKRDRDPNRFNEIVLRNPAWRFLEPIQFPFPSNPSPAKSLATPAIPIEARSEKASQIHIDLGSVFNASLDEDWQKGGLANNDLKPLPRGLVRMGGIEYDLRGIVQLTGKEAQETLSVAFPNEAMGIQINQPADRLHFLHACAWSDSDGTEVATYHIHYEDGQSVEIPIQYGIHLRDWWAISKAEVAEADIAWMGQNAASSSMGYSLHLYHWAWENPRTNVPITRMDFHSASSNSAPFLLAITAEKE